MVRAFGIGSVPNSESQIDDLDEEVGAEHAFGPDCVEIGERFFRGRFLVGLARGFQFLNAIAGGYEHVAEFGQVGLIAEGAMAGNDFRVVVGERQRFVGRRNHAIDFAAAAGVDYGVNAVEKGVTHVDDVGLFVVNVDVGIGVGRRKVLER